MLPKKRYEFLFIDLGFFKKEENAEEYTKQLEPFWSIFPGIEIIILTSPNDVRSAVNLVRAGVSDYLTLPIDPAETRHIIDTVRKDIRLHSELRYLRNQFWRPEAFPVLKTQNERMKAVFEKVRAVAPTETTVFLMGETGTGKGVIANLIHRHSRRSERQFIQIHCGAIPETLLESELFGHEKGAFTGADRRKLGKFEIAQGGTLFLDEIGTISASMQIKLLQILQDRTYQRVGGETVLKADVRIIVATNADLKTMCEEGQFRRDLYYRLNVFPIEIPKLRDRREDIPLLVNTLLDRLNRFSNKRITGIDPEVIEAFQRYDWPGNIRELENVIERAYILEDTLLLTMKHMPAEWLSSEHLIDSAFTNSSLTLEEVRKQAVARVEREYLSQLLTEHKGVIHRTAEAVGIGVRQLHKLMTRHGLKKEDFKPT
jgi:DNA-binding NtrC family response regulator